jgi:hypothetical protein
MTTPPKLPQRRLEEGAWLLQGICSTWGEDGVTL